MARFTQNGSSKGHPPPPPVPVKQAVCVGQGLVYYPRARRAIAWLLSRPRCVKGTSTPQGCSHPIPPQPNQLLQDPCPTLRRHLLMPGAAMAILEITTCVIPLAAAL